MVLEPRGMEDPWAKNLPPSKMLPQRIRRLLASPMRSKYVTLANRARRIFPGMPFPYGCPAACGGWTKRAFWIRNFSSAIRNHGKKVRKKALAARHERSWMLARIMGSHTLPASKCVAWHGRVVAIEASPRERLRLQKHLRLNRSSNVKLIPCAVGEDSSLAELYVVERFNDVCHSLRRPETPEPVRTQRVRVRRLDDVLSELGISTVDFLKLDAEGAELSVLYGAMKLLSRDSRPAMLRRSARHANQTVGLCGARDSAIPRGLDYQRFAMPQEARCRRLRAIWKHTTRIWSRSRSSALKNF